MHFDEVFLSSFFLMRWTSGQVYMSVLEPYVEAILLLLNTVCDEVVTPYCLYTYRHGSVYCKCPGLIVNVLLYGLLPHRCWPGSGWTWSLECASGSIPLQHLLNVCSQTLQSHWTDTEPGSSLHPCSAHCLARCGLEWTGAKLEANGYMLWWYTNCLAADPLRSLFFLC